MIKNPFYCCFNRWWCICVSMNRIITDPANGLNLFSAQPLPVWMPMYRWDPYQQTPEEFGSKYKKCTSNVVCKMAAILFRLRWVNSLWPIVTPHDIMDLGHNIGSGNGLLPDGTKPLPEPMLSYYQLGPLTFTWGQFHKRYLSHQSLK